MAIDLKKLEVMFDTLFSDEAIEEKFWDWYVARNKAASTAKPNVELPRGVKLCDCPECGAEIQYGLAQDVIDKFNKVFGTKGAKPNVSGELGNDEKLANEFIWRDYLYIYLIVFYALFWMVYALFNL